MLDEMCSVFSAQVLIPYLDSEFESSVLSNDDLQMDYWLDCCFCFCSRFVLKKYAIVFALIAVAAADVSHLYLPPAAPAAHAAPSYEAHVMSKWRVE